MRIRSMIMIIIDIMVYFLMSFIDSLIKGFTDEHGQGIRITQFSKKKTNFI
jgi:hypothetical protein